MPTAAEVVEALRLAAGCVTQTRLLAPPWLGDRGVYVAGFADLAPKASGTFRSCSIEIAVYLALAARMARALPNQLKSWDTSTCSSTPLAENCSHSIGTRGHHRGNPTSRTSTSRPTCS